MNKITYTSPPWETPSWEDPSSSPGQSDWESQPPVLIIQSLNSLCWLQLTLTVACEDSAKESVE